jgi:hypothetical protein
MVNDLGIYFNWGDTKEQVADYFKTPSKDDSKSNGTFYNDSTDEGLPFNSCLKYDDIPDFKYVKYLFVNGFLRGLKLSVKYEEFDNFVEKIKNKFKVVKESNECYFYTGYFKKTYVYLCKWNTQTDYFLTALFVSEDVFNV